MKEKQRLKKLAVNLELNKYLDENESSFNSFESAESENEEEYTDKYEIIHAKKTDETTYRSNSGSNRTYSSLMSEKRSQSNFSF